MKYSKYFENQYNPFILNKILYDAIVYEKVMPSSFGTRFWHKPLFRFWLLLIIEIYKIIVRKPIRAWFYSFNKYISFFNEKVVFVLPTRNNYRSLHNVVEEVKQNQDVTVVDFNSRYEYYPSFRILFFSFLYLPRFCKEYKKLSESEKRITSYYMFRFLKTPGYTFFYSRLFERCTPKVVVLSNDHGGDKRALAYVCKEHNIKTIYSQHASVSSAFPELCFSCSFLDGVDAFEKYTANGKNSTGEIILLGANRYDQLNSYRLHRKNFKRNCIGVAINMMDNNERADSLCNQLLSHYPDKKIKIRSHPAMKNHPLIFSNTNRIVYTCASDESMVDYLDSIDLQVSNDSGVHLDTLLGGVPTVAFNMSNKEFGDNYGYIRNGLLPLAKDANDVFNFIDNGSLNSVDVMKVRLYDESYGKSYSGKSSHIIADFILHDCSLEYLKTAYGFQKELRGSYQCYISR